MKRIIAKPQPFTFTEGQELRLLGNTPKEVIQQCGEELMFDISPEWMSINEPRWTAKHHPDEMRKLSPIYMKKFHD